MPLYSPFLPSSFNIPKIFLFSVKITHCRKMVLLHSFWYFIDLMIVLILWLVLSKPKLAWKLIIWKNGYLERRNIFWPDFFHGHWDFFSLCGLFLDPWSSDQCLILHNPWNDQESWIQDNQPYWITNYNNFNWNKYWSILSLFFMEKWWILWWFDQCSRLRLWWRWLLFGSQFRSLLW